MSSWIRQLNENDRLLFRQLERIFAEYPPSVTKAVTNPLSGMQRKAEFARFAPNVPQIVAELNREMKFFRLKAEEHQAKRLTQEMEADQGKAPLNPRHLAYWINRDPANMPDPLPVRTMWRKSGFRLLSEIAADCGVTQEQIDAMPNIKQSTGPPSSPLMTAADYDEAKKNWG